MVTSPVLDRRALFLVAQREFRVRARDKPVIISFLIMLVAVLAAAIIPSLASSSKSTYRIAYVGDEAKQIANGLKAALAPDKHVSVKISSSPSVDAAKAAVKASNVTLAVVSMNGSLRALSRKELSLSLMTALQQSSVQFGVVKSAMAGGMTPEDATALLDTKPIPVDQLVPTQKDRDRKIALAGMSSVLLFFILFFSGMQLATSVVEEKASRTVELLLSRVRPRVLLAGKIAGVGLLAVAQFAVIAIVGLAVSTAVGTFRFTNAPSSAYVGAALFLVLGFIMYSAMFAVGGALAGRLEDLQSTAGPLNFIIMASYFAAQFTVQSESGAAGVVSLIPTVAPFAMPGRMATGDARPWHVALALVVVAASAYLLVGLAARVYERSTLRTGQQKLRSVLKGSVG